MTQALENTIKNVCIYIRKSRANEEEDLDNHLSKMVEIAETNGWSYQIFKEVVSGKNIADRPVFSSLLREIENGDYDAILVFDTERLSRGTGADTERITWTLSSTNTMIVTGSPYAIINPNDEADADLLNIKSFFGNYEYKNIRRRLMYGRKKSISLGQWNFGAAPYGYIYNRDTKRLDIHPEQSEIVRRIVETYINTSKTTGDIAWELNKESIPTKRGSHWSASRIRHLLLLDIYLGNTTYNKSEGERNPKDKYSSTPFKQFPKSEWRVIRNTHPALITEEQRKDIESKLEGFKKTRRSDRNMFELSGLCYTPDGRLYTRHVHYRSKDETLTPTRPSDYYLSTPEKEPYIRVPIPIIEDAITSAVKTVIGDLEQRLKINDNSEELGYLKKQLEQQEKQHEIALSAIDRAMEGFMGGLYSLDKAKELKLKKEEEQRQLELDILETRNKIDGLSSIKNEDRKSRLEKFLHDIQNPNTKGYELNQIYKSIIREIVVERTVNSSVKISINFL